MAIGIDTSKWKPRKIKGTPAAKFRNALGVGIISVGILSGLFFHFSKITLNLRKATEVLYEDPIEEVERRLMIASGMRNRTGDQIRQFMEIESRPDLPNNKSLSPCNVRSKYFMSKSAMDESLSDFKESKKHCSGPKNTLKTVGKTIKPKQVQKRIRGQKDIRNVLKAKEKELESYTKEFDNICKQSGIDVDSEQLQLAIALSKSLQQSESSSDNNSLQSLTTQSRIGRIRTTLQEYGFKIPEIKITNKRPKKRKQYKLLLTTDLKRRQVISDKYSQVLFENLDSSKINHSSNINLANVLLYRLSTNADYDLLKDNQIFYVGNLVEKSSSTGVYLRDWAEIPGRPITPEFSETYNMNFSEIECSQDELDVILSGTIKNAKNVIKKQIEYSSTATTSNCKNIGNNEDTTKLNKNLDKIAEYDISKVTETVNNDVVFENNIKEIINLDAEPFISVTQQHRSCSPDIFDDDLSSIMVNTEINCASQELPHKVITDINNDFMDLTECINGNNVIRTENSVLNYNKNTHNNITRRKSDDFMEITYCIASSSQPVLVNKDIDLTHSPDKEKATVVLEERKVIESKNVIGSPLSLYSGDLVNNVDLTESPKKEVDRSIVSMDLTQSSSSSDDLPFVNLNRNSQHSLDNTIILNVNEYERINVKMKLSSGINKANETLDLTAEVCASPQKINRSNKENILSNQSIFAKCIHEEEILDLTGEFRATPEKRWSNSNGENKLHNESIFEEYVHDHSNSTNEDVEMNCDNVSCNMKPDSDVTNSCKNSDIDLTQTSSSSDDNIKISPTKDDSQTVVPTKSGVNDVLDDSNNQVESSKNNCNKSRLGKRNKVSIDYDDITKKMDISYDLNLQDKVHSFNSVVYDIIDDYNRETEENYLGNGLLSNLSQNYEPFEISDRELDYSLHKSKLEDPCDNLMFGGISILDNFSNDPNCSKSTNNIENNPTANNYLDKSMTDNILPDVNMKNNKADNVIKESVQTNPYSAEMSTPHRNNDIAKSLNNTPRNCDFIVKTNGVTPMADYASMSTPERNRELDKYGLKPFKRKRAIQLLTHIYNQTHPIMEPYSKDDLPSPSKKRKQDNVTSQIAHKRLKSPKKTERSPRKVASSKAHKQSTQNTEAVNEITYEITNELPDIKNIHCGADEWVFQKREKAKVHTCRLPLHIAFHNYVSCRRGLREAILRYEPVNIDVIHKDLVAYGHRYDPKDLLKFMDKKCITVKTMDNDSKNNKI